MWGLVGVRVCLGGRGDDREKLMVGLAPSPPVCWRESPPAGECRPPGPQEGEKGCPPGTQGLGLLHASLGDMKEVGLTGRGLLNGDRLLTC